MSSFIFDMFGIVAVILSAGFAVIVCAAAYGFVRETIDKWKR